MKKDFNDFIKQLPQEELAELIRGSFEGAPTMNALLDKQTIIVLASANMNMMVALLEKYHNWLHS